MVYGHLVVYQFSPVLPLALPNLKFIRLWIKHPFYDTPNLTDFAKSINSLSRLQSIDLITESKPSEDRHPNWTYELRISPRIIKLKTLAKVIPRENCKMNEILLDKLQATNPLWNYQTVINDEIMGLYEQFEKIKSWKCQILIQKMINPSPLSSLKNIQFTILKQLSLPFKFTETIEPITKINAPLLSKLVLTSSSVCNLQCLMKIKSRVLSVIQMEKTNIHQIQRLYQGNWQQIKAIKCNSDSSSEIRVQSVSFITKLKFSASENKQICIKEHQRISQLSLYSRIYKKIPKNIEIVLHQ